MKIFKITLFLNIAIIAVWVFYIFFYPNVFKKEVINVPNIVGSSKEEALKKIKENKLNYDIIYIEQDNDNLVIDVFPKEQSLVKEEQIITIYISKKRVDVLNDYTNLYYTDVSSYINDYCEKYDISINKEIVNNEIYDDDLIISQEINNSILHLKVSLNTSLIKMPNLIGNDVNESLKILKEIGLTCYYKYEYSFLPFNAVIDQSIKTGEIVKKKNKNNITITVSKGYDLREFEFVNKNLNDAIKTCEEYDINYNVIYIYSNDYANKIIDIKSNIYYDINEVVVTFYVTKN